MTRKVLITGGAGFIGSRVVRRFVEAGYQVTVLDSLIAQVHGPEPILTSPMYRDVREIAHIIQGSVSRRTDVVRALEGASIIVHLAAETGTGQSMYDIQRYVDTNVGGTAQLLDVLTNEVHDVTRVVVASSRSIYGEGAYRASDGRVLYPGHRLDEDMAAGFFDIRGTDEHGLHVVPTDESSALHPSSVYGITKQTQEALTLTVGESIGIEAVSLRYQNVYGPGQSLSNPYTGILSIFSTLIRQGKGINVFEDGLATRDFVYVDDVAESTFRAATLSGVANHAINVGSGVGRTVLDVVEALFEAYGTRVPATVTGNYRLGDIRHNVADIRLMGKLLRHTPVVEFSDGVQRFAEWVLTQPIASDGYAQSLREMAGKNLLR